MKTKTRNWLGFCIFTLCFFICFLLLGNLILHFYEQQFYYRMAAVVSEVKDLSSLFYALKEPSKEAVSSGIPILKHYGYHGHLLSFKERWILLFFTGFASCLFFALFLVLLFFQRKRTQLRIQTLTDYLKQINCGIYPLHSYKIEDEFSLLEDEIYKTVTALRESRNQAISAKENLAKNMADISHQLKTPLTSLSLMTELMQQRAEKPEQQTIAEQILHQTDHLRTLVVALLNLSRMDAGVLQLISKEIVIEELLSCAAEPVLPLFKKKQQKLQMQGDLDGSLFCDIGWTAEGIGNILKNCSEHAPECSQILITVFQNPIYTEIRIEDSGEGFEHTDLSYLFERFYKGKHSAKDSIGIGLVYAGRKS